MADNSLRTPGRGETILTDELTDGTLGTGIAWGAATAIAGASAPATAPQGVAFYK